MGWFRTPNGHLVHGDGGLAAVYRDRGYKPVTDKQAAAGLKKAQARAALEAKASKAADERDRTQAVKQAAAARKARAAALAADLGIKANTRRRKPTRAEQMQTDQAIRDEAPKG